MTTIDKYCGHCGSRDIEATALVRWGVSAQCWELVGILDDAHCTECSAETRPHEADLGDPLEEALNGPTVPFDHDEEVWRGSAYYGRQTALSY